VALLIVRNWVEIRFRNWGRLLVGWRDSWKIRRIWLDNWKIRNNNIRDRLNNIKIG
jgi:hypothetical protein